MPVLCVTGTGDIRALPCLQVWLLSRAKGNPPGLNNPPHHSPPGLSLLSSPICLGTLSAGFSLSSSSSFSYSQGQSLWLFAFTFLLQSLPLSLYFSEFSLPVFFLFVSIFVPLSLRLSLSSPLSLFLHLAMCCSQFSGCHQPISGRGPSSWSPWDKTSTHRMPDAAPSPWHRGSWVDVSGLLWVGRVAVGSSGCLQCRPGPHEKASGVHSRQDSAHCVSQWSTDARGLRTCSAPCSDPDPGPFWVGFYGHSTCTSQPQSQVSLWPAAAECPPHVALSSRRPGAILLLWEAAEDPREWLWVKPCQNRTRTLTSRPNTQRTESQCELC